LSRPIAASSDLSPSPGAGAGRPGDDDGPAQAAPLAVTSRRGCDSWRSSADPQGSLSRLASRSSVRVRSGAAKGDSRLAALPLTSERRLWGSRSRPELLACSDRVPSNGHDHGCVATSRLPDLRPAHPLAVAARPYIVVQRHRAARPAPRGRCTPQNQPQASPGLGRPSRARRADPAPPRDAARSSPDHPGHGPAVAPPAGGQKVDLPEPGRSPTPRRHDRRPAPGMRW
jgi:hypothetical protein